MQDTEDANSPNIMWEIVENSPLVMAFTGMARGLNELANFEFVKSTKDLECSKVFCRDPNLVFYHLGINDEIHNINELSTRLQELIREINPTKVICVGVSAGGYAALLFGHLLWADRVHAFGPQVILYEDWGIEHDDFTIYNCAKLHEAAILPANDFRDLSKILSEHNGKTKYTIHIGENCQQDLNHVKVIENCPGVEIMYHSCEGHACASHVLKNYGVLGQVIIEG